MVRINALMASTSVFLSFLVCWTAHASPPGTVAYVWKSFPVDVDGDGIDETLFFRTDEDVYHLGALESHRNHVGILGSGPGWGLRYSAWIPVRTLLDTGVRGGPHMYNTRIDSLEGENVVTEWEADDVVLRRVVDMTDERAIMVFGLVNLLDEHIRDVCFKSEFRFDDFTVLTLPAGQTIMGWDGYRGDWPDSPAIFKILHIPEPAEFEVESLAYYGLTEATWGPNDLCSGDTLEFALLVFWNRGLRTVDSTLTYLDEKVAEYMALADTIVSLPVNCDSVGIAEPYVDAARTAPGGFEPASLSVAPTPFAGKTVIRYALSAPSVVRLEIRDCSGRLVSVLADKREDPGIHEAFWDGLRENNGVYFVRFRTQRFSTASKIILLH